eukprot:3492929-Rhodomonas_salina.2
METDTNFLGVSKLAEIPFFSRPTPYRHPPDTTTSTSTTATTATSSTTTAAVLQICPVEYLCYTMLGIQQTLEK